MTLASTVSPRAEYPGIDPGFTSRAVNKRLGGEWTYDEQWRPERGFALHRGWFGAILKGQQLVAMGLNIDIPVLTMLSTRSLLVPRWSERMRKADTAIDVKGVAERAPSLGANVTIVRVRNALHDIFLSAQPVRSRAYCEITRWLRYAVPDVEFHREYSTTSGSPPSSPPA